MVLPTNFSPWEHFQSTLIRVQNLIVRREFKDVGGDTWDPDISSSRASLRVACTLTDEDTAILTLLRLIFYYIVLRHCRDFIHPSYGSPLPVVQRSVRFQPQIFLYFLEDEADVEPGQDPTALECSVRIMDVDSKTISSAKINQIANAINTQFNSGSGYIVKKGKDVCSYTDKELGYSTWGFFRDRAEGVRFFTDLLSVQGHSFKLKNFNHKENGAPTEAFPVVPERIAILGESVELNAARPIAEVRFQYALLHLHGRKRTIPLVDRTGIYLNAIHNVLS